MATTPHIELLTVSDCPNREVALGRLHEALQRAGIAGIEVAEQVIDDPDAAARASMHGSPTVLVDGQDPFAPPGTEASVSCRRYPVGDVLEGAPSVDDLVAALTTT